MYIRGHQPYSSIIRSTNKKNHFSSLQIVFFLRSRERRKKKEDVWKFRRERGKLEFEKEGGDKLANFLFVLSGGERRGETGRGDERILQKDKKK